MPARPRFCGRCRLRLIRRNRRNVGDRCVARSMRLVNLLSLDRTRTIGAGLGPGRILPRADRQYDRAYREHPSAQCALLRIPLSMGVVLQPGDARDEQTCSHPRRQTDATPRGVMATLYYPTRDVTGCRPGDEGTSRQGSPLISRTAGRAAAYLPGTRRSHLQPTALSTSSSPAGQQDR
jgi:hypothetical protein